MSKSAEGKLSGEDHILITANQLGDVFAVYRLQPDYIRLLQRMGWLLVTIGGVILVISIIWFIRGLEEFQLGIFFSSLLAGSLGLFTGMVCLPIVTSHAQQEHVIICEQGLLRRVGSKHVEVVRWKEIQAVEKKLFDFSIAYALHTHPWIKVLHISGFYQNVDEIIDLVNKRIKIV